MSKMHKREVISLEIEGDIRFSEVDSMNVVWHGNYLKYFEDAREAFGIHYGMAYIDIYNSGFLTPIVKSEIEHKFPLKYGDKFRTKIALVKTIAAKIVYEYEILNVTTGKISAVGKTIQVFIDNQGELQLVSPRFYKEWFNRIQWEKE
ncbi:acyl-CoA thioesterase [Wandonia haliotis]|uniref:Acyl-CoA thioesterase n=2 Tax=Wandonia haliotis TaxID=574963 RepID=A0ABP3XWU8_9FLAO